MPSAISDVRASTTVASPTSWAATWTLNSAGDTRASHESSAVLRSPRAIGVAISRIGIAAGAQASRARRDLVCRGRRLEADLVRDVGALSGSEAPEPAVSAVRWLAAEREGEACDARAAPAAPLEHIVGRRADLGEVEVGGQP